MHKKILLAAAIFGALGVAAGAFGAHGLKKLTTDPDIINSFETGARYQLLHAVALLGLSALAAGHPSRQWGRAAICFAAGIILFSGSLYLISFLKIREDGGTGILGPLTPLGGVLLIAGWIILAFGFRDGNPWKKSSSRQE